MSHKNLFSRIGPKYAGKSGGSQAAAPRVCSAEAAGVTTGKTTRACALKEKT